MKQWISDLRIQLLFGAALLLALPATSQHSLDIFTLSGLFTVPGAYESPLMGEGHESGLTVNLKVPVVLRPGAIWYNDFSYSLHRVTTDLNPEPSGMLTSLKVQGMILQTGLVKSLGENKGLQLLFVPRFMTDTHGSDSKSWQFGGIGLYEKRMSDKLLMRFGALYNSELFGPLAMPLVYLDWKAGERWTVTGLLPIQLKVNYHVSERFTTGISHFGLVQTFRVAQAGFEGDYIERTAIDLTLFGRWKVAGGLHLETRFGYSVDRKYVQYDEDQQVDFRLSIIGFGDDRVQKNVAFAPGPIAQVRLVYAIKTD
jgi:hypothetical protein